MKKNIKFSLILPLIALTIPLFNSCGNNQDVFHIMTWNEEWKTMFKKYLCDEHDASASTCHFEGKVCKFTTVPSENASYQMSLDRALKRNAIASRGDKVDMFLAESDYITKYVNSDYTKDIAEYNIDMSNTYDYTVEAASDREGHCKGVSFQCCPAGIIYRRSIAKQIFNNDGAPENVGPLIDTWDEFNAAAKKWKEMNGDSPAYMTGSFATTFRIYSSGVSKPWIDEDKNLQWDDQIINWVKSTEDFINKKYTQTSGIWEKATSAQMYKDGKTFCFDGPAWYYNFSMSNAQLPEKEGGCPGDWAIVKGPEAHFWGGTWLIAASNNDDDERIKKVMDAFINDVDLCKKMISEDNQYVNNKVVNASAEGKGNEFLGGQDDIKFFNSMADSITFEHKTIYDQDLNEGLQSRLQEHYVNPNQISLEKAIKNFYSDIQLKYPQLKIDTSYIPQ